MPKKEFKLIVAGGRQFNDMALMDTHIRKVVAELPDNYVVTIISGMAPGADYLAYQWADIHGCKCIEMPAKWAVLGKRAGFIRNKEMADEANGLLAFWDGVSKGTEHMIVTAQTFPLEFVRVIPYVLNTGKITTYKDGVLASVTE